MDLAMVPDGGVLTLRDSEEPALLASPTTLTGSVDEFSGAVSGVTFATAPLSFEFPITDPVEETVYVDAIFSEVTPGSATGSVTKANLEGTLGDVTIDAVVEVDLHVEVGNPPLITPSDCTASPIALKFEGLYDSATQKVTLTDSDFSVPTVPTTDTCPGIIADGVNERLAGGGHSISLDMTGSLWIPLIGVEPTVTTLTVTPEGISDDGDEITLTSTVAPDAGAEPGTPTGFIDFRDGATSLGKVAVDGTGAASLATSDLPVGPHQLTAMYLGDQVYAQSTSAATEHLVAARPTVMVDMAPTLLIGGQPRQATITVTNPPEFSNDVDNVRVDIAIARLSQATAQFVPSRMTAEWLDGSTWEPITLATTSPRVIGGTIGVATGFPLPAGAETNIKVRLTAPFVGGSTSSCGSSNETCPGNFEITATLQEVDPGTGTVVEPIAEAVDPFALVESSRRVPNFLFTGGAPRPHTIRQGYTTNFFGNSATQIGGLRPSGEAEVYIDGQQVLARKVNAAFGDAGSTERIPVGSGNFNAFWQAPADLDPGTHFVTIRYLGDTFFAPVDVTTTFTILPSDGHQFVCREEGFTTRIEVGANVQFDAELPSVAAAGESFDLDVASAVVKMSRQSTPGSSPPFAVFNEGIKNVGDVPLNGIGFALGPDGTGSAIALERQGGTQISGPNPGDETTVDQTITFHGPTASAAVEGEPGVVVPVELTSITLDYVLADASPFPYTMVCTPVGGPLVLGEVEVAGTTLSADPEGSVREKTDEVTFDAETFPADAAGTVTYTSDIDGVIDTDAVVAGESSITTDELTPGVHQIRASFNATDPSVPDTVSDPVTVKVQYSPRTTTQAFVIAARTDYTGAADKDDVLADAGAISAGKTKTAYLSELSRSDAYLTHVVNEMYLDTLGREGDASGVEFWIGRLRAGWSVARVASSFYSSNEYYQRVGGTDAAWVGDLYEALLGRAPDTSGQAFWVGRIASQGRGPVALSFFQTPESARARVVALYQQFLGRNPNTADRDFWATRVIARGDLILAVELTLSPEYASRAVTRFPLV